MKIPLKFANLESSELSLKEVIKITAQIYKGKSASQIGHKVLDLIGLTASKEAKNPLLNSIRD